MPHARPKDATLRGTLNGTKPAGHSILAAKRLFVGKTRLAQKSGKDGRIAAEQPAETAHFSSCIQPMPEYRCQDSYASVST